MPPLPGFYKILIIEDDRVSVMALQRALRKLAVRNDVHICHDGIDALSYLATEKASGVPLCPHLVILDLNMPRMGGLEFLEAIRDDPLLVDLRVLISSGVEIPQRVEQANSPHVTGHLHKDRPYESLEQHFGAQKAVYQGSLQPEELR
ncbi:response regulator [Sulfitobacter aestuariivivens]|uniref:Response regulator n=1 Tax=Sulfitobacter aestuariivivens TaxID=2766981 RepID=A0A927D3A6_9RHOB|nr:response regulator [Sulfitobacter aestuariivivens]